jgi:hypothetical protein
MAKKPTKGKKPSGNDKFVPFGKGNPPKTKKC